MAKPRREMSREEVLGIRQYYDAGYTIEFIAGKYRRHRDTISDVVNYRTHKRVKPLKKEPALPADLQAILKEEAREQRPQKYAALRKSFAEDPDAFMDKA